MDFIQETVVDLPTGATPDPVVTETDDTAAPETEETPVETPEAPPEKTFTQAELDAILQKRIAKVSRQAERDAVAREQRIQQEVAERFAKSQPQPVAPSGEPKPQQFQDYESYIAALTDFKVEQRMNGFRQESEAQQQARAQREQAETVQQKFSAASKKYDDFIEVVTSPDVPISIPMRDAIADSEHGGEVAYYLGNHIDEADRISRLSPVQQVREILKLETKLTVVPAPTKTPPPIVPNKGNAAAKRDTFELPWKEFVAQRNKEMRKR